MPLPPVSGTVSAMLSALFVWTGVEGAGLAQAARKIDTTQPKQRLKVGVAMDLMGPPWVVAGSFALRATRCKTLDET